MVQGLEEGDVLGLKIQVFRIGIKNYPPAHGGVESATFNFIQATKERYDFTVFTVWPNPSVVRDAVEGARVRQLATGWIARFWQIRAAVVDKSRTVLHFHMEVFIPLAIVFSLLGYNVVSSVHGRSWRNVKIGRFVRFLIAVVDILGVNLVRRTVYVSKADLEAMRKYTLRRDFLWIPNGSPVCHRINECPTRDMVFIGRISVQKNLAALIEAADRDGRDIDIYGPIDEREVEHTASFRRLVAQSSHAHYCGVLAPEQIYPTLSMYRCAVNPSKSEASPNAVIEAGACGLFLYLSDIPGHRDLEYPDVYYFDKDDVRLPSVMGLNRRSHANIRHHRAKLSEDRLVSQYAELYESI